MNEALLFVGLMISLVSLSLAYRITGLERRLTALTRLDGKLDLLLEHGGIVYDPFRDVPQAVADAVKSGKKILAIKSYRDATGVSLKEAKDRVEELMRRAGIASL